MKPFQLTIRLQTPMILGGYGLRLDGLLWHTLFMYLNCPYKALEAMPDLLAQDDYEQYFKAGNMMFAHGGYNKRDDSYDNLLGVTRATVGVMRMGSDLSPDNFAPNSKKGDRYTKVQLSGGVYKNRLDKRNAYFSNWVVFHGNGRGQEIAELIEYYVPAIGVNANIGFGTIGGIKHKDIAQDFSVIREDGKPARPIPLSDFNELSNGMCSQGQAILKPPFRNQEPVLCAMPERVKKIKIKSPGV